MIQNISFFKMLSETREYFSITLLMSLPETKSTSLGAVLKRSKNFQPSAVRQCPSPSDSPPTDGPSDHNKLLLTLPLSDVRRPTWGQCKHCIGLASLYRIDPTVLAPGRTSDDGQGQCQEEFLWSDEWADSGQKET